MTKLSDSNCGHIHISSVREDGFLINDVLYKSGSMAIFHNSVTPWNIKSLEEVTTESLLPFTLLSPPIEILVLGTGEKHLPNALSQDVKDFLRKKGILYEIVNTKQAAVAFNFLKEDGRFVAAGLICST